MQQITILESTQLPKECLKSLLAFNRLWCFSKNYVFVYDVTSQDRSLLMTIPLLGDVGQILEVSFINSSLAPLVLILLSTPSGQALLSLSSITYELAPILVPSFHITSLQSVSLSDDVFILLGSQGGNIHAISLSSTPKLTFSEPHLLSSSTTSHFSFADGASRPSSLVFVSCIKPLPFLSSPSSLFILIGYSFGYFEISQILLASDHDSLVSSVSSSFFPLSLQKRTVFGFITGKARSSATQLSPTPTLSAVLDCHYVDTDSMIVLIGGTHWNSEHHLHSCACKFNFLLKDFILTLKEEVDIPENLNLSGIIRLKISTDSKFLIGAFDSNLSRCAVISINNQSIIFELHDVMSPLLNLFSFDSKFIYNPLLQSCRFILTTSTSFYMISLQDRVSVVRKYLSGRNIFNLFDSLIELNNLDQIFKEFGVEPRIKFNQSNLLNSILSCFLEVSASFLIANLMTSSSPSHLSCKELLSFIDDCLNFIQNSGNYRPFMTHLSGLLLLCEALSLRPLTSEDSKRDLACRRSKIGLFLTVINLSSWESTLSIKNDWSRSESRAQMTSSCPFLSSLLSKLPPSTEPYPFKSSGIVKATCRLLTDQSFFDCLFDCQSETEVLEFTSQHRDLCLSINIYGIFDLLSRDSIIDSSEIAQEFCTVFGISAQILNTIKSFWSVDVNIACPQLLNPTTNHESFNIFNQIDQSFPKFSSIFLGLSHLSSSLPSTCLLIKYYTLLKRFDVIQSLLVESNPTIDINEVASTVVESICNTDNQSLLIDFCTYSWSPSQVVTLSFHLASFHPLRAVSMLVAKSCYVEAAELAKITNDIESIKLIDLIASNLPLSVKSQIKFILSNSSLDGQSMEGEASRKGDSNLSLLPREGSAPGTPISLSALRSSEKRGNGGEKKREDPLLASVVGRGVVPQTPSVFSHIRQHRKSTLSQSLSSPLFDGSSVFTRSSRVL
ncbi:hypothetical protein RCL1_001921 [Eukaryota sp. TZLM3-RCL]